MRNVRLFCPQPLASQSEIELGSFEANYVSRVLRLRAGDSLTLFDGGGGDYDGLVVAATRNRVRIEIGRHHPRERESPLQTTLVLGVSKGERMDIAVQKSTELGVSRIVPVMTRRTPVKLDVAQGQKRRERWHALATNASQQCGRNRVPEIDAPVEFANWVREADASGTALILDPGAAARLAGLSSESDVTAITLLVGPEGGFDDGELTRATAAGFRPFSLGPRTLRTETAVIVALSVIQATLGDLAPH